MQTLERLKQTPLFGKHCALEAKMVGFGGWDMPLQYEGILAEYKHTRTAVSVFDTSHMGEFVVTGDCDETGLNRLVTMAIKDMSIKTCRYGLLLNEQGCAIDDLIIFREEQNKWFIVVNGATTTKDAQHFQRYLKAGTDFKDCSSLIGKLDVQGPLSRDVLGSLVDDIEKLEFYHFDYFSLLGERVLISRTGYTGELGYEIYFPWEKTSELWQTLLDKEGVKPAGLGARDVLRLEVGYSLYGHELTEDINPLAAGLSRFIDFDKDFIGKDVLLAKQEQGIKEKMVGFTSETRRSPRFGHKIYTESNLEIGVVTSGTFAPCLNRGIGMGFVLNEYAIKGNKIFFGDKKNKIEAQIRGRQFYKNGSLKK